MGNNDKICINTPLDYSIEAGHGMLKSEKSVLETLKEGRKEDLKREKLLLSFGQKKN